MSVNVLFIVFVCFVDFSILVSRVGVKVRWLAVSLSVYALVYHFEQIVPYHVNCSLFSTPDILVGRLRFYVIILQVKLHGAEENSKCDAVFIKSVFETVN